MTQRAENRKYHYTYQVTCAKTEKVFYGIHSSETLDDGFSGAGSALYMSKKNHGEDQHKLDLLQFYPTRKEAKAAYADLKASQLINPKRPGEYEFHFVYKTVRDDGKYYIGVHSTNNLNDKYLGSGTYISRSIKKHGRDKHKREILEMCASRDHAFEREIAIITPEILNDPLCMNGGPGGQGGSGRVYGITEETRKIIGAKSAATPRTPEWNAKISASHTGKVPDPEVGKRHSEKMKGRKQTSEQILARVEGQKNSTKFKERYRPVIIDGVRYESGCEASTKLGIPGSTLKYRLIAEKWTNYQYA